MLIEFRTLLKEIKSARAHQSVFSGHFLNETSRWIMRSGDMNGDEKSVEWQLSIVDCFFVALHSLVNSHTFSFNPHCVSGHMTLGHL